MRQDGFPDGRESDEGGCRIWGAKTCTWKGIGCNEDAIGQIRMDFGSVSTYSVDIAGSDDVKPWDSVPAPGGAEYYTGLGLKVKDACIASSKRKNQEKNPRFKDFANLRTGGLDGWSSFQDIASMIDQGTANKLEGVFRSKAEVTACLRWYGRSLKFRHCIWKVLVDAEIRENAAKSQYH